MNADDLAAARAAAQRYLDQMGRDVKVFDAQQVELACRALLSCLDRLDRYEAAMREALSGPPEWRLGERAWCGRCEHQHEYRCDGDHGPRGMVDCQFEGDSYNARHRHSWRFCLDDCGCDVLHRNEKVPIRLALGASDAS